MFGLVGGNMTLDQFIEEVENSVQEFAREYRENNKVNPEHYPLELPDENSGLWWEFLMDSKG